MQLTLAPEFGYVVFVSVASFVVLQWMAVKVVRARKEHNVKYPTLYSDTNLVFNCVQRAHQNTLENYPVFLLFLLLGGVQHPVASALGGAVYLLGRIVYAQGYYTGLPENRNRGAFGYAGLFTMLGCTVSLALHLLGIL